MIIHEKLFNAVILNVAFSGTETWEPLFQFLSSSVFLRMCWRRVLVTHLVFHCYDNKFPHLMAYHKLCSDNSWDDLLAGLPSVGSGEGPLYLEKSLASPPSLCAAPCHTAAAAVAAVISSPTPYFFPPAWVFCLFVLRQFFVCCPGLVSVMRFTQLVWSMLGSQVWATGAQLHCLLDRGLVSFVFERTRGYI